MSGGGSPSFSPSSGREDECASLVINTQLSSPIAAVLSTISVNDKLEVAIQNGTIVVISNSGNIAGTIIGRDAVRLKNCMEEGYDFYARVLSINGGSCNVLIKSKS